MRGHSPVGEAIKRAGLFEAANLPFMLQNVGGNITLAFVAHMAAALDRATLHHVTATNLWAEDVVTPAFAVVSGQVRVPEVPGLGVKLDRQALVRLQARQVPPLPKALVRIAHWHGPTSYARPPLSRNPLLDEREVPGYGEGYNLPLDQDYWYDDGSGRFARLWDQTGKGLVVEAAQA